MVGKWEPFRSVPNLPGLAVSASGIGPGSRSEMQKKTGEKPPELAAVCAKANQWFIQLSWPGEAGNYRTFT